jgi:hypothetical protein
MRRKLQEAYQEPTYERAREKLSKIRKELQLINQSAVNILDEGLKEDSEGSRSRDERGKGKLEMNDT